MKFSVKGLALASGILWGLAMLGMGLANLIWSGYGQQFLGEYPTEPVALFVGCRGVEKCSLRYL